MKNIFVVTFFSVILGAILLNGKQDNKREITLNIPYSALNSYSKKQVECLAQNILFEAGKEPVKGQIAVAMVTIKRTRSSAYPDSICEVVRQRTKNVCQFSWWCDRNLQQKAVKYEYSRTELTRLNEVRKVAMMTYLNYEDIEDPTHGAMFYHADYVNPQWKLKRTTKIGAHIFYKRS